MKRRVWRLLGHLGLAAALFALGTLWHEAGHGLAAIVFGARVVRLNVLGVQLYPALDWDLQPGYWGRIWWQGHLMPGQRAWELLSGNLATLTVSIVALPLYLRCPWRGLARTALLTLSFFFLDALLHTLPTFGLPMYFLFGRRDAETVSEGYQAAVALGLPGWVFQVAVVGYAILAVALIGRKLWPERPRKRARE